MNERDSLLKAVCANPEEDTPRLVFADWLDEHGDPARAEFIRLQIEIAGLRDGKKKQQKLLREKELLDAHREEWSEPLKPYFAYYYRGSYARFYAPPVVFRRGFVETISMDVDGFLEHCEDVFDHAPIRGLRMQDAQSLDDIAHCEALLRLHTLDFPGAILSTDGSGAPVLFRSKKLANLRTLVARGQDDNGHLDTAGLRAIAGNKHLANLSCLDISDNWLFGGYNSKAQEDACRELLWKLGESLPALRELRLHGMGLHDADVRGLVAAKWAKNLRVLDLSGNQIGAAGCKALCASKKLKELERLDLTGNSAPRQEFGPAERRMLKAAFGKRVVL